MDENVTNINNNIEEKEEVIDGNALLNDFIGKNAEVILKKKYSIPAFFFGGTYYIYRKMYAIGIILYLIQCAVIFAIEDVFAMSIITILISALCCMMFPKQYKNHIKYKLEEIVDNDDGEELRGKVQKEGGTNLKMAIVIPLIISVIFSLIFK